MTTFQGYKGRIERADLTELSNIVRQIENDRKLTGKDRIVLESVRARRIIEIGLEASTL